MLRSIILALTVLACAAASWKLNAGQLDAAIRLGGFGVLLAVLLIIEADRLLLALLANLKAARAAAKLAPPAVPAKGARGAHKNAPRGRAGLSAVQALPRPDIRQMIPRLPEAIDIPWMAVLVLALLFFAAGQFYMLVAASVIKGSALTVVGLFLGWRWWQRSEDSIHLALISTLPQFLACAAVALALWGVGIYLIWGEGEGATYLGTALTWLGTVLGSWAAWTFIEKPLKKKDGAADDPGLFTLYELPGTERSWGTAFRWPLLGMTALFLTFMATSTNYVISLGFMVLAIAAFLLGSPYLKDLWQDRQAAMPRWAMLAAAALALWAGFHGQDLIEKGAVNPGLWWFLAAALALAVAFRAPEAPGPQRSSFGEKAILLALVLAAFIMRFKNVGLFPYGVEGDEAGYGIVFNNMNHVPQLMQNFFRFNNVGVALYWLGALCMKVLGVNVLSLRLASVIYGTLSIFTFYFMARLVLRWQAALLGAVALTVSTWHLHFSRFGHLNISQVFVQSACFYFFFKGMLSSRMRYFAAGGVCLGLAFMAHTAGKLVPFFFIAFLIYLGLVHFKALARRSGGILIFFLFAWATIAPVMTYYIKFPLQGTGRIKEVSIMNNQNSNAPADAVAGAAANFRSSFLMFNYVGDSRSRDNALASASMLDHWSGVFFILGLGFALYHWKRPFYAFMLLAFFGTLSASIISVEAPQSLRTAGNIPICYFFVAVFFDRALDLGRRAWAAAGEKLVILGLSVALVVMAQSNLKRFFLNDNYGWDLLPTLIGMHAGELGDKYEVRFFSENFGGGHPPVTLFANGTPIRSHGELLEALPLRGVSKGIGLATSDRYRILADYLYWLYPQGKKGVIKTKTGTEIYDTLTLDPAQIAALYGWEGTLKADGQTLPHTLTGVDFAQGLSPAAGTLEGHWQGTLFNPDWATERFSIVGAGQAVLRLNGKEVARTGVPGPWMKLPIGPHNVELSFHGQGKGIFQVLWERKVTESGGRYWALGYDAKPVPLPNDLMLKKTPQVGFIQHFYAGTHFEGAYTAKIDAVPFARWIDGPIGGPFSCVWTARLKIEKAGDYGFFFNGGTFSDIEVAGRLIERRGNPDIAVDNRSPLKTLHLNPGTYPIKVRCAVSNNIFMELTWSTPDSAGQHVMIHPRLLQPEPLN